MRILFAVDLTEPEAVTSWVESFADGLSAELFVLHVLVPTPASPLPVDPMTGFGDLAYTIYDPEEQEAVESAERHDFEAFLAERFSRPVRPALLTGEPAKMILADADELDVDLVIVGKRHHSALERFLLGCVSESVMLQTSRPVLVVPIE